MDVKEAVLARRSIRAFRPESVPRKDLEERLDRGLNPYALMDGGVILQTIALLAVERGLGTCFLAQAVRYPDVVRRYSGISADQALVMGMAAGVPIEDHPINLFRSERGRPEEFLRFLEIQ